jgi:aminoglycoside 6'-N-acetyltransferase
VSEPIRGDRVRLVPATEDHVEPFVRILNHPDVAVWWDGHTADEVRAELAEVPTFAIELDGEVIGLIQYGEEDEPKYRHANIDIALHPDRQGKGLGAEAVRALARHMFEVRGHHRVVIDPAASNARAIRSYQRVGFRPVGVMRRYERGPDGGWRDGLLMDLLPEDLTP